jgi:hypothetical protein
VEKGTVLIILIPLVTVELDNQRAKYNVLPPNSPSAVTFRRRNFLLNFSTPVYKM